MHPFPELMPPWSRSPSWRQPRSRRSRRPRGSTRTMGCGCGWSGFSYDLYFDQIAEGDKSYESHGVKLVVDQMSLMYLMGTQIDYVEGLQGAGFKFNNPNVKSTCGCGSSFSA